MSKKSIQKKHKKLMKLNAPGIKRWTYVLSVISIGLTFWAQNLYIRGDFVWYEGNDPMLLVTLAIVASIINLVINSSLFILQTSIDGKISILKMGLVSAPLLFTLYSLIQYPGLYSIPIAAALFYLIQGKLGYKKHSAATTIKHK